LTIALVLNDDFAMWHFFRGLIAALGRDGHRVYVVTPDGPYVARLTALGAVHHAVGFERFLSPIKDLRAFAALYRFYRTERIDLVCNITVKPIVYGGVAARLAGVKRVVGMIEGLGYAFGEPRGASHRLLQQIVKWLYRIGCGLSDRVGFANGDDLSLFVRTGTIATEKAVPFRSMIGVNVDEFSSHAVDDETVSRLRDEFRLRPTDAVVVMVVARLVWSKGVREFIEAAHLTRRLHETARFLLVGPLDPSSPESVPEDFIRRHSGEGLLWVGFRSEVREILQLADVVVLPSYYREGVPRVLLEALAMSKPVVTTDSVGCREVVEEGENGFLVPAKDAQGLADAIGTILRDDERRKAFGRRSRAKARTEFDERHIIHRIVTDLYEIPILAN
jgi:N,N'-diacetylbacillosaminyl-diphospho-undecaprenol alpha-1,3-N-acetylgalactosaminyltransferase